MAPCKRLSLRKWLFKFSFVCGMINLTVIDILSETDYCVNLAIMAFYIKPPHGYLSLARIEYYTQRRLEFLITVATCHGNVVAMRDLVSMATTVEDSDCLIEGTRKDIISHFMLRLISSQDVEMETFFKKSEVQLFSYRFSCMTQPELGCMLKPLRRLQKNFEMEKMQGNRIAQDLEDIHDMLKCLTRDHSWKDLIHHYIQLSEDECFELPFYHVPCLVAKRVVTLCAGMAAVPCCKLADVMTTVAKKLLTYGLRLAKRQLPVVLEDKRMKRLFKSLKWQFRRRYNPFVWDLAFPYYTVKSEDVDHLSECFPPCMRALHKALRTRHRLRHFSRIQYTLFLKELGMPVNESLQFWKKEYCQPSHHVCAHTWEKDAKRYTYNIRHLYGLEGSRINYRAHCCSSLQNGSLAAGEDGGCLFKRVSVSSLREDMIREGIPESSREKITSLARNGEYSSACQMYLCGKVRVTKQFDHVARCQSLSSKTHLDEPGLAKMSIKPDHVSPYNRTTLTDPDLEKRKYSSEHDQSNQKYRNSQDILPIDHIYQKKNNDRFTYNGCNERRKSGSLQVVNGSSDSFGYRCNDCKKYRKECFGSPSKTVSKPEQSTCIKTVSQLNQKVDISRNFVSNNMETNSNDVVCAITAIEGHGEPCSISNTNSASDSSSQIDMFDTTDRFDSNAVGRCLDKFEPMAGIVAITTSHCCYDHDVCPPTQSATVAKTDADTDNISSEPLFIDKPINYYISYRKLLDGLK